VDSVQHILLVEDSEDDALLIRSELRTMKRRLEFRRVDCREDMRAALADRRWDLVITDHHMAGFDSVQAFEELKRSGQDAPFVIMSGTLPEHTGALAMQTGASDFIDKTNRSRLVPVVERELRNSSMRRAKDAVERKLVHLNYHDALTGLPNRAMLERLIEHHLTSGGTGQVCSAFYFLDLDRFVRVNEALGYAGGDEVLRRVAERLVETVGDNGVVGRVGQDNFGVYVDRVDDAAGANDVATRISAMFERPFHVDGDPVFVHGSIGVCLFPQGASSAETLITNAERAKFAAKKQGPAGIVTYARAAGSADVFGDALRLESALRHAIAHDELFVLYQPLVDVGSGRLVGTEALVRWHHPRHGVVGPEAFIPFAEDIGMIGEIGRLVLERACRQTRTWQDSGRAGLSVAVNVSASQFRAPGFVDGVAAILERAGLEARFLELELIESELMDDAEASIETLSRLKDMGVRLSIDDFGTGYSSLSYLNRLPIDVLKIDKSFIRGSRHHDDNHAIARTVAALAHALGLETVAEGVETKEQLELVREIRCERAQGYLFARPLEARALAAFDAGGVPEPAHLAGAL
jgi:diguanylate cyclase (GGDEF)-like protein